MCYGISPVVVAFGGRPKELLIGAGIAGAVAVAVSVATWVGFKRRARDESWS
jgi:hypothetical protein